MIQRPARSPLKYTISKLRALLHCSERWTLAQWGCLTEWRCCCCCPVALVLIFCSVVADAYARTGEQKTTDVTEHTELAPKAAEFGRANPQRSLGTKRRADRQRSDADARRNGHCSTIRHTHLKEPSQPRPKYPAESNNCGDGRPGSKPQL